MRYLVDVNGVRRDVSVTGAVATTEPVVADSGRSEDGSDAPGGATLDPFSGTPARTLRIGERVMRVMLHSREGRGRYVLEIEGHRYTVEALDERTRVIQEMVARNAPPSGPAPIVAPMPGLIVRVNVQIGDQVSAGESVIVMEAMKMENELRASAAGRVKTVKASPGTPVEKGTILIELE
ncbi:MAG: acetyl-CoA carboxylase biotin carboxyl carrier protein subunit [Gemmatimonadaceae bacterium]